MNGTRYIEIPGNQTHELPPLLLHSVPDATPIGDVLERAAEIVEAEDMIPGWESEQGDHEQRKYDLALNLAEHYQALLSHWAWGDSIIDWIRQCEITFELSDTLRNVLHPDVWPHANRSSFVNLLVDKSAAGRRVELPRAVGLRLTFRQPPPIDCFSNQFLFYLNSTVADSAYQTWAHLNSDGSSLLPPNRFTFQVLDLAHT